MNSKVPELIGPYKVTKVIFSNSHAAVAEVKNVNTSQRFAAKFISRKILEDLSELEGLEAELRFHKSFHHENVVDLVNIIYRPEYIVIVLELCACDLWEYISKRRYNLPIHEIVNIWRQILNGLNYVHSKNISHRDIKSENILMTQDGTIKICDFGSAECEKNPSRIRFVGSLPYIAPEVFRGTQKDTKKCDIWSLGILLYFLTTGELPWRSTNDEDLIKEILTTGVKCSDHLPLSVIQTIRMCCQTDPNDRPTVAELLAAAPLFDLDKKPRRLRSLPAINHGARLKNQFFAKRRGGFTRQLGPLKTCNDRTCDLKNINV